MKRYNKIFLFFLIVVLLLTGIIFYKTYNNYSTLRSHRAYFRTDAGIQPWMTVSAVIRHYNISEDVILQQLNVSKSAERMTLDSICKQNHLNCTQLINNLNNLSRG